MTTNTNTKAQAKTRGSQEVRLPGKTERIDWRNPCTKCDARPTRAIGRGRITTERACSFCGHIEYMDAPDIAL